MAADQEEGGGGLDRGVSVERTHRRATRRCSAEGARGGGGDIFASHTRCLSSDSAGKVMTLANLFSQHTDGKVGKEPWRRGPEIWTLPFCWEAVRHFSALEQTHP